MRDEFQAEIRRTRWGWSAFALTGGEIVQSPSSDGLIASADSLELLVSSLEIDLDIKIIRLCLMERETG